MAFQMHLVIETLKIALLYRTFAEKKRLKLAVAPMPPKKFNGAEKCWKGKSRFGAELVLTPKIKYLIFIILFFIF